MGRLYQLFFILLAMMTHVLFASAQEYVKFVHGNNWSAAPIHKIDSIKINQPPMLNIFFKDRSVTIQSDSTFWNQIIPDTLTINYQGHFVSIHNPRLDSINTDVDGDDVTVKAIGHQPFTCMITGKSDDGRFIIDSDITFTLMIANLNLTSQKASAISLLQKQKRIVLVDRTINILKDRAIEVKDLFLLKENM